MRVLLVDDNEHFLHALAEIAAVAGLDVVGEATSGEDGCRLHDDLEPDLVLTDLQMPGMNGYEVAEHVRTTRPETKIVLMSASPTYFGSVLAKESLSPETLQALAEDLRDSQAVG